MGYVYAVLITAIVAFPAGYVLGKWAKVKAAAKQIADAADSVVGD